MVILSVFTDIVSRPLKNTPFYSISMPDCELRAQAVLNLNR